MDKKVYIFRITHIENIPHILKYGITHRRSINFNKNFKSIGSKSLISVRDKKVLPNNKKLGEYIPFYFGQRSPMLHNIENGFNGIPEVRANNIIYLVSTVQKILELGNEFIFTNGHANDRLSEFFDHNDVDRIHEILDRKAITSTYWAEPPELKRKKESEFLVLNDIPYSCVLGMIVSIEYTKIQLCKMGIPEKMIAIRPSFYYKP